MAKTGDENVTSMMRQYRSIKETCGDAILMFRSVGAGSWLRLDPRHLGILSAVPLPPVLDVTLTSKPVGDGKKVPLAGIPYHALNNYLFKLTRAGYRVSIREQTIKKPVVLPIRR